MQLTIFIEGISRKKDKRRLQFGQLDMTNGYTYVNKKKNECKPHVKEEHLKTYTYIYGRV